MVEAQIGKLREEVEKLKEMVGKLSFELGDLRGELGYHDEEHDRLEERLKDLEKRLTEVERQLRLMDQRVSSCELEATRRLGRRFLIDWKTFWRKLRKGKRPGYRWVPVEEIGDTNIVAVLAAQPDNRLLTKRHIIELRKGSKGEYVVVKERASRKTSRGRET